MLIWENDPDVRKWSFNKKPISIDQHKVWFKRKLADENVLLWIMEDRNLPAGMVRIEKKENMVLLNYLVAPRYRGKKLASKMLGMAITELNNYWKNAIVYAYTLLNNIASIKSLENAGFILDDSNTEKKCYVFNTEGNR